MTLTSELTFPSSVTPTKEWDIWDSIKLQLADSCWRRVFYAEFLGWKSSAMPNLDLEFGVAWHLSMEHIFDNLNSDKKESIIFGEAYELFLTHYREFWDEDWDVENAPKDPANALLALQQYKKEIFPHDQRDMEVLYTEVVGSVPIDDTHVVHFKIDAIINDRDGISCMDHKTTKSDRESWRMQWDLSLQLGAYIHALYALYPEEDIFGAKVNGVVLRKMGNLFIRVPVRKTKEQMLVWLWNRQYQMQMLDWNIQALAESSQDDEVMQCFPLNPKSCTDWGRTCPYHTFCCAWPNPLRRCEQPPPGFEVRHWNPREEFSDAKFVLEDGSIGKKVKEEEEDA